jgi:hypothetical protein
MVTSRRESEIHSAYIQQNLSSERAGLFATPFAPRTRAKTFLAAGLSSSFSFHPIRAVSNAALLDSDIICQWQSLLLSKQQFGADLLRTHRRANLSRFLH